MTTALLSQKNRLQEILDNGQRIMFMLAVITLPFRHLPVSLPLVGGDFMQLFIYAGFFFCLVDHYLFPKKYTVIEKQGLLFLATIILWNILCTIVGISDYPYYNQMDLLQMDKFKNVYDTILVKTIAISDLTAIKLWLSIKAVRTSIFNVINTYLTAFWIYALYHEKKQVLIEDACKAVTILVIVMSLYSIVEVGYLTGNDFCRNLLMKINPIYIKVADTHGWWPPLLWKKQLRSLFLEPSFLGIAAAFLFPVLCRNVLRNFKVINLILVNSLILMIFLTKARTATLLFVGEIGLFCILFLFKDGLNGIKKICPILISTVVMFACSLVLLSHFSSKTEIQNTIDTDISSYIEENIMSVSGNKRSNSARFGNVRATFLVGLKHPIFGVGKGLKATYIRDNFAESDRNVGEIRLWIKTMEEKGPLKSVFPILNGFADQIAQTGIIGLLLFMLPMIWIFCSVLREIEILTNIDFLCFFVAYVGVIVALLSNDASIQYYFLTGILMVFLTDKDYNLNKGVN